MPAKHETWMPLFIADYLGDTLHLTTEQHGAYLLLLMAAWKRGGHVPDDDEQLATITRAGDRWQTHCGRIVRAFFEQRDGLLFHKRVEAELLAARDNVSKKSQAGAAGAAARWQPHSDRNAKAKRTQSQTDAPSPSPISSSLRSEEKARKRVSAPARPEGVSESTWADWLHLRRTKKAPVTATVIEQAKQEAVKAGVTLQRFLEIWCIRGSQGLQADWLRADERRPAPQAQTFAERDREAGMRRWEEMTGQVHPDRHQPPPTDVIDMDGDQPPRLQ